ncbi:MAG: hypothetical protein GF387_01705 [Candidatus Portnoybacteria bacterium]|nr:hypothetical protein [Candidatus Portnoybacteria bacterium]
MKKIKEFYIWLEWHIQTMKDSTGFIITTIIVFADSLLMSLLYFSIRKRGLTIEALMYAIATIILTGNIIILCYYSHKRNWRLIIEKTETFIKLSNLKEEHKELLKKKMKEAREKRDATELEKERKKIKEINRIEKSIEEIKEKIEEIESGNCLKKLYSEIKRKREKIKKIEKE